MLTFWIIVLSLGLLSVLVPPFFNFISYLISIPIALIASPFVALSDHIKKKRIEKYGPEPEDRQKERAKNKKKISRYAAIWSLVLIPLVFISMIIMETVPDAFFQNHSLAFAYFIGVPIAIPTIVVLISWLTSRNR